MRSSLAVLLTALAVGGCQAQTSYDAGYGPKADYAGSDNYEASPLPASPPPGNLAVSDLPTAIGAVGQPAAAEAALAGKIIYTAAVDLVVEEFSPVPGQVEALIAQHSGYVARSNLEGTTGSPRSGEWTVRMPVERYAAFLEGAKRLGEIRRVNSDSQDVSEEFYDIEARVRNKKQEETRLLKRLEDSTAELEDILAVEREISRVRGEIEQMEGRLRVLRDLTALTTVTLRVQEIKGYVPEEAPTYGTQMSRAWDESIHALKLTLQNLSIAVVVALPWIAVLLVPVLAFVLFVWLMLALRRRARARQVVPATAVE